MCDADTIHGSPFSAPLGDGGERIPRERIPALPRRDGAPRMRAHAPVVGSPSGRKSPPLPPTEGVAIAARRRGVLAVHGWMLVFCGLALIAPVVAQTRPSGCSGTTSGTCRLSGCSGYRNAICESNDCNCPATRCSWDGETCCLNNQALSGRTCYDCPAGERLNGNGCTACSAGQYQPATGSTSCISCDPNSVSCGGAVGPGSCADDFYWTGPPDRTDPVPECVACAAGTSSIGLPASGAANTCTSTCAGYCEGFESSSWDTAGVIAHNPTSQNPWTRQSGGTPSGSTGPNAAYAGSYYLFTEATVSKIMFVF